MLLSSENQSVDQKFQGTLYSSSKSSQVMKRISAKQARDGKRRIGIYYHAANGTPSRARSPFENTAKQDELVGDQ